jgi:hypothetical protein
VVLGREDRDVAEAVTAILREDGVAVLLDTLALRVRRNRHEVELDSCRIGTRPGRNCRIGFTRQRRALKSAQCLG